MMDRGDIIPTRNFSALVKEKIPLFFIAAVDAMITMVAEHKASPAELALHFFHPVG